MTALFDEAVAGAKQASSAAESRPAGSGRGNACDADDDNDGWPDTVDCQPLDKLGGPGTLEICDGLDQDCDGEAAETNAHDPVQARPG